MKKILLLLTCFVSLLSTESNAAISVAAGSNGTNICSNLAQTGSAPAFTTLGSITLSEGLANDITLGPPHSLVLTAPTGWRFNTTTPPTVTYVTGRNILFASVSGMTSTTVTINIAVSGTTQQDFVFINGLQMQATSTTSAAGNITASSFAGLTGITPATNFASLSLQTALTPSVTVAASPSGPICSGTSVTFTATPVNGGVPSYSWEVAGSPVATGISYTSSSLADGNTVRVVMTATGCVTSTTASSALITMTVNPTPAALTGPTNVCTGQSITLSSTTPGGTWSSTTTDATVSGGVVTGVAAGVSIISYNISGCSAVKSVIINPTPDAFSITGGGSYCVGGTGLPIGLSGSASGITYELYQGSTLITTTVGTGSSLNFGIYTASGTYTAIASDVPTGCTADMTGSTTISATTPLVPSVNVGPTGGLACAGVPTTFNATPTNGGTTPSYQWLVNGAPVGVGASYAYTASAGDLVSVILTTGGICSSVPTATDVYTVTLTPLATPAISINSSANPACQGSAVTFSATPTLGGSAPAFRWTKNGINVATGATYSFVPTSGDVVYCQLTSSYACRTIDAVLSNTVTVSTTPSAPLPVVNVLASPGTNVPAGTTVMVTAMVSGTTVPVSYQWHLNGTPIPGATDVSYTSNSFVSGDIVTCKVTNMDPCAKSSLKSVSFGSTASVPNSADLGGVFSVTPNPNRGEFTLSGLAAAEGNIDLNVVSMLGQVVYTTSITHNNQEISEKLNLGSVPAGLYILSIKTENGSSLVRFSVTK